MVLEPWPTLALPLMAGFIALPAVAAWQRRRASREASAVAGDLATFAASVRASSQPVRLDDTLCARLARLRIAESASLHLVQELSAASAARADAAQRLASRLRRRVAFDRKMLARTAPGLRRGAIAASVPPLLLWLLPAVGVHVPGGAQAALFVVEAAGCALLWRLARVEI